MSIYIYIAKSVQTGYFITSTKSDVAGQNVATTDGNGSIPEGARLFFDKPLNPGNTTDVTIKGINGLYVALPENATSGSKLVWSNDAVNWQVDMTSPGVYEIIPKGQDLYWITDKEPVVEVKDGKDIVENENKWSLTRIDREERTSA
ncbi:hypothetical protein ARMGADRAFT_1162004 [Armillaria gallica]|uniref:Ricin B lectin domain-containing protein n=1 Tax=Armillaria gallica TaxID=47427 RepID=A0A2H3EBI8_ARMGA|nr:hypothetical protein ARMGADRAFT_1162004 [Armillaria gallica]